MIEGCFVKVNIAWYGITVNLTCCSSRKNAYQHGAYSIALVIQRKGHRSGFDWMIVTGQAHFPTTIQVCTMMNRVWQPDDVAEQLQFTICTSALGLMLLTYDAAYENESAA